MLVDAREYSKNIIVGALKTMVTNPQTTSIFVVLMKKS